MINLIKNIRGTEAQRHKGTTFVGVHCNAPLHFLCAFVLCAFFFGCAFDKSSIKIQGTPLPLEEVLPLIEKLRSKDNHTINTISEFSNITIKTEKGSNRFKGAILFEKDKLFRLEALGLFGQPVMYMIDNYKHIRVYYPDKNIYFYGMSSKENIGKLINIVIEPSSLFQMITGGIIFPEYKDDLYYVNMDEENIYLFIKVYEGKDSALAVISKDNLRLKSFLQYDTLGKESLKVYYNEYQEIDGHLFPVAILIDFVNSGSSAKISNSDITINERLEKDIGEIKLPDDAQLVDIDKIN